MSDFFEMLTKDASEASQKARWVLAANIVIAVSLFLAVFNFAASQRRLTVGDQLFPKQRVEAASQALPIDVPHGASSTDSRSKSSPASGVAQQPALPATATRVRDGNDAQSREDLQKRRDALKTELVKQWVEESSVNISLLGIRVDAVDATFIGTLALAVSLSWLLFAFRRENHIIGRTVWHATNHPAEVRRYVANSLRNSQVFATLTSNAPLDEAVLTLDDLEPAAPTQGALSLSTVGKLIILIPGLSALLMMIGNLLSYFVLPQLTAHGLTPWKQAIADHCHKPEGSVCREGLEAFFWDDLGAYELSTCFIDCVLLVWIYVVTRRLLETQDATRRILAGLVQWSDLRAIRSKSA